MCRASIAEDYLLTNDACDLVQFILTRHEAHLGVAVSDHPLLTIPEDIRCVLFGAHIDYLNAMFDQITRDHGDVREYLRNEIGIDDALRVKVQTALLST